MTTQNTFSRLVLVLTIFGYHCLFAADRCVAPGGKGGCFATIGAAVAAAAPHDVVRVSKGTYHENVVITKPLSLLGDGSENTIVDATDLLNAITVDGGHDTDHLDGVGHVNISGLTMQNAKAQGIVVINAFDVTI